MKNTTIETLSFDTLQTVTGGFTAAVNTNSRSAINLTARNGLGASASTRGATTFQIGRLEFGVNGNASLGAFARFR